MGNSLCGEEWTYSASVADTAENERRSGIGGSGNVATAFDTDRTFACSWMIKHVVYDMYNIDTPRIIREASVESEISLAFVILGE